MTQNLTTIIPDWPLNEVVVAGTTISDSPFAQEGFNLAAHVDDSIDHVRANRACLMQSFDKELQPMWLSQTHSNKVIGVSDYRFPIVGDAAYSDSPTFMPVVLTADCLPILLADGSGRLVAAIHAGWPGLHNAIIANTIANMPCAGQSLYAWIGPSISQNHYEVDENFYQRFIELNQDFTSFFASNRPEHYLADLSAIARHQLQGCGLSKQNIYASDLCSYADPRFFSYRRDGAQAGRMATFIFSRSR